MKVKELFATPDKWTKGVSARDKMGFEVVTLDDGEAVSFCLHGAICKLYDCRTVPKIVARVTDRLGMGIIQWNDATERTHAEVLALCKELDI